MASRRGRAVALERSQLEREAEPQVQHAHCRPDRERPARGGRRLRCGHGPASQAGPCKGRRLPQPADAARARARGTAFRAGYYTPHEWSSRALAFHHCVPPAAMCRPATEASIRLRGHLFTRMHGRQERIIISLRMHVARQARAGALGAGRVEDGPAEVEQQKQDRRQRGGSDQRPAQRLIRQHAHAQHRDEDAQRVTCATMQ